MRFRNTILIPLIIATIVLGTVILLNQSADDGTLGSANFLARSMAEAWFYVSSFLRGLWADSAHLWDGLPPSQTSLLYGATAVGGVFMMLLVIKNGINTPKRESEIESLLKDLRKEKEQAQNLARLKSEFLNQVSHELRTPLAVIMGYVECIIDGLYGHIDDKNKEILKIVAKQSTDLQTMIERILIFSRLEAGKTVVRCDEFPLDMLLTDLKDTFDFLGRQKGLKLVWDLPEKLPKLKSDPERIRELLNNLVQNAIKYTDRGSVSVQIRHVPATDSIFLEVADTGIGIPTDSLNSIFDPFIQVHKTSTENSRGGIGLGLSIVKRHVELLKGTIDIESNVGKGTRFRITLPRIYKDDRRRPKRLLSLISFSDSRPKAVNE
jgi:signal transduction histidine kinase